MLRLLILALVILVIWLLIARALSRLQARFSPSRGAARSRRGSPPAIDRLVPCAACGVRIPAARALIAPDRPGELFCSQDCRRRAGVAAAS